jgi:murein DD-endopeptidase MepM/ murein hydrolase activator NlpD|nr:MAG TPA: peptidase [Caudoviricetes sp.]
MASKDKKYQLSEGRKKQLEQARRNAKNASKQSKPASNYLGGSTKKTTTTKKTSGTQNRNNTVSRSTGGKSTVTNRNVKQADKVNSARPYRQSVRSLGDTVGITREGRQQRRDTARQNNARHALQTAKNNGTLKSTGTISAPAKTNTLPRANAAKRTSGTMSGGTARKTGKTWNEKEERQKAIDTLNANSIMWHNTTDEAERNRLHEANNQIRKSFGMTYRDKTGATYLPKAGGTTNVSTPVVKIARGAALNRAATSQAQRQQRVDELNSEIERMQKQYPYLINMDVQGRNTADKAAAIAHLATHPKLAIAGINGSAQYDRMSADEKKQAQAIYQLYKRLNDESNALSKMSAAKSWGSGAANTLLNATGAVENAGRYVSGTANKAAGDFLDFIGKDKAGQFLKGTAQKTLEGSLSDKALQAVNEWAQPVGMAKKGQEFAGSAARMAPGIAANMALPGASLAMIYGDSAKSGVNEAQREGATLDQAMLYGTGAGLTELGTEKMFSGIPGMGEGVIKTGNGILGRAADILGEGAEEAASTFINPYLKRATYNPNAQNATAKELLDSAKGGIAMSALMQGASGAANRLADYRYGTDTNTVYTSPEEANRDMVDPVYALPNGQRFALPEGSTRTANTLYANENGSVANNLRAFNDVQTPDVLYGNMRGDFTASQNSGNVLYAGPNGQVAQSLPTGYLPEGRSTKTKIAARGETRTIPLMDEFETNGGLYRGEMEWAKLLIDNSNETGVPIKTYIEALVDPAEKKMGAVLDAAEQYVKDYKKQGVSIIQNGDGTGYRASNNEDWYSQFYRKYGRAPRKSDAADIAREFIQHDLRAGGGNWVSPELAREWSEAQQIRAAYDAIGDDAVSAEITPEGLKVMNGTRARTEDIRETNAGRNAIVSPAEINNTAQPLDLNAAQGVQQGAVQVNPPLRDIRPTLRTAAQAAQESAQSVQPEITQPMQGNAQGAALGAQQTAQANDINPTLKKAGVTPESSVGAAATGFDPYSKMVNDYGAIPEGENPARVVDVPKSTNGEDRVRRGARTFMESGITTDEMIPSFEQEVANGTFSYNVKTDKSALNNAVRTINKKGWQGAMEQWEDVTDGRRTASKDDIVLAETMYSAAVKSGDTQTAMRLAAEIAAEGTRAGQEVQAIKLLKKTTPEGQLYYLQKAVEKIQQEYQSRFDKLDRKAEKKAAKNGVPGAEVAEQHGITLNEDLVQEFLNAPDEDARKQVVDKIYDDIASQIPATAGDRLNAWRYFAMLGNPRTHIRNIMGNVASAAALDTSHKVSAVGQKFLPQEKRTRALHTSKAAKQFAKADYANVEAELSGNAYKTEMSEIKQRQKLFPKPLQKVMDANTWALDAEDQVFKKKSYIDSMGNFLTARGWDVNNLTEAQLNEARQHAIQDAKIATFQDASKLADTLSQLEKKNKATEVIIGSLVPFKRTPINVAKRSFELSPVGLLKAITYDAVQVKKGNMDATKMIDHIGQGLTGSSVAALGAFLAAQGIFSAGSSDDDKEANLDAGMGQQEYAINLFGKSYTIDWASPAVVPLAMGGELYEALHQKYDDDETAFNQAMATVSRMFDPMLNMTMLSGIGSTVTSAAYNKSNPLFGIASNVATNFGGQFVPTLFGQVARTVDNTRRTTYADKNIPVPSSVQKFLQRQANKIPGLSQNQPAYTDVWGREQKNGPDNVFARAAYNFLSPGYLADAKSTQTEKALKELYQATGDNSVLPSKPQKYYKTEDGTKKFLTAQEYSALTSEGGKIALDALGKLTKSEAYKGMTNDEKIEAVSDVYKYAKAVAANKTYGKELEGTIHTVKDSGIEPGLYYAYKEMEDSYNDSMESWEARDQTFNSIKSDKSLSEQEKNSLYHTLLIKGTSDSQWDKYQEISDKVTAEEFVDAMIQKQAITKEGENIDKGRAAAEATEFSYYLDAKGYTGAKREALENTFKFYSMVKADPANYTFDMIRENGGTKEKAAIGEVESAGISAPQYAKIKTAASGVTYEKGKKNAKIAAVGAAVSQNTASYEQYAAVMHALGYKKIDGYYTSGGKLPEDKKGDTGISVNRATGFSNPTKVSDAVITSGYGSRSAPTTNKGKGSKQHDGIDIGGSVNGQAADSIGGGKVTEVGYDENGYGNYVVVDHGGGYTSLYGHLQKATVKQGDTVSAGQQVGVIGSTGNSSGPHLHLRVHKNGQSIDPRTVIPGYGG